MNKAINEIAAIFFLNTTTAITSTKKTTPTPTANVRLAERWAD
jgi:hypothetical protein